MKKISDLTRDHRAAAPVNELLAPAAFLTQTAVLTKQQDIFSVICIRGVDPECIDPEEIDHAAMRFESALRTLGPEFRVYQYALKRERDAGVSAEFHRVVPGDPPRSSGPGHARNDPEDPGRVLRQKQRLARGAKRGAG